MINHHYASLFFIWFLFSLW